MNNDKNSHQITPSGTTAHPEQTVPDNNHNTRTAPQPEANRAVKSPSYDLWQDPFALFDLERFNFVAGVILLVFALSWTGCELFTVRPEIKQAIYKLETRQP